MTSADSSVRRTVLVVCFGNLCRSPMAEALLRIRLPESEWRVISAGTHAVGGDPPTHGSQLAMSRIAGLDISAQRSEALTDSMLREADFVFTMSRRQAFEAAALRPEAASKIRLLGAFAPATGESFGPADPYGHSADALEVADPMGGDQAMYDACCERLTDSANGAVDWLVRGADLDEAPAPVASWLSGP